MRRGGILHPTLNRILTETGHTDILTICDKGFSVPQNCERLDLALVEGIPTVLDVLRAIEAEFVIDTVIVTEEMKEASPERYQQLATEFPELSFTVVSHARFKEICPESRAVIRTGDAVPYANIMIVSG
ncbi:D-ribose pyranase [Paenibacillus contaminans]|uniref:D-ribose pyranase n=1 Tax=Paenibacillus contaminans TaxID=450362 RepID=A0A329MFT1_9BACL|nr:D-ribose pyranase [Paenibacillus contaminans]RAV18785.1 D-ribose pyranase [Paenibacillus contaminans]